MRKLLRLLVMTGIILLPVSTFATMLLPMSFDQVVGKADIAFQGTCLERKAYAKSIAGFSNSILVTEYTYKVEKVFKGNLKEGENFVFTQVGATPVDARMVRQKAGKFVSGASEIPTYQQGSSYVVFLTPKSRHGIRTPIGLAQGTAKVVVNDEGLAIVKSPYLKSMFQTSTATKSMAPGVSKGGAISLDDFVKAVDKTMKIKKDKEKSKSNNGATAK